MTGQLETLDELTAANRRAQARDEEALADAGLTYAAAMEAVEEIDRFGGVKMAYKHRATVKVDTSDVSDATAHLDAAGYEYEIDEEDDVITVTLPRDDSTETDDDGEVCPECGSRNVKEGACPDPTRPMDTADYGCRDCHHLWDDN